MKIYPYLRVLWLAEALSAVSALFALGDRQILLLLNNILTVLVYILLTLTLRPLRGESGRFSRAFYNLFTATVLIALFVGCTLLPSPSKLVMTFLSLCLLTSSFFSLFGEFHLYWALDERILPCGYVYPARRIRWCFYLPLIGSFASATMQLSSEELWPGVVVQVATQCGVLGLLGQYNHAVKMREADNSAM